MGCAPPIRMGAAETLVALVAVPRAMTSADRAISEVASRCSAGLRRPAGVAAGRAGHWRSGGVPAREARVTVALPAVA